MKRQYKLESLTEEMYLVETTVFLDSLIPVTLCLVFSLAYERLGA